MSKNLKNRWIVNIDGENLHIFWTTWEISVKFSGKIWLMIILKVTKSQGFTLSLEYAFLKKPQEGGGGAEIDPYPSISKVRQSIFSSYVTINIYHT